MICPHKFVGFVGNTSTYNNYALVVPSSPPASAGNVFGMS